MTTEQKIEIAEVILAKWLFMDELEKILKDCKITKNQARECLLYYTKIKGQDKVKVI